MREKRWGMATLCGDMQCCDRAMHALIMLMDRVLLNCVITLGEWWCTVEGHRMRNIEWASYILDCSVGSAAGTAVQWTLKYMMTRRRRIDDINNYSRSKILLLLFL